MTDLWTFLKNHPFKIVALIFIIALLIYSFGCEPKVASVVDPLRQVNKYELEAEVSVVITQFENKFESIAKREEIRNALFNASLAMFRTGQVDPLGIIVTLGGVLGFGALGDDVRLRRKIKLASTPTTTV